MILQALVRSYDALAADGKLDQPGWLEAKVSWSIELDADGRLKQVIPQGSTDEKGKSIARSMKIPAMAKRSSGIAANFLCDNAMYMLGVDLKGKKARAMECFRACAARHLELLEHTDEPFARAICAFFKTWDAENAESHPLIAPILELLKAGGNLVFSMNEAFAQDVPERGIRHMAIRKTRCAGGVWSRARRAQSRFCIRVSRVLPARRRRALRWSHSTRLPMNPMAGVKRRG